MAARGIDTHAHLFLEAFAHDIEAVTHRAQAVCEAVLLPNLDVHTLPTLQELTQRFPGFYHGMLGLHPTHVREDFHEQLAKLRSALTQGSWVAIGEVGLDAYHDAATLPRQREALHIQAEWAREMGLPLSIHFRAALDDTLEVLKPFRGEVRGVFHCFTGDREEAFRILNAGFVVGLGGVVTFKNAPALHEAVQHLPAGSFVLETDSPYLSPHPYRGRRNESSYLTFIARAVAALRGVPVERVYEETTATARQIFPLKNKGWGRSPHP